MACGSLTACQSSKIGDYATTEVAKYGNESIKLEEANFWLRYQQVQNEAYYGELYTYFGYDNMWMAASGYSTQTMGDYTHQSVMSQLWQTRVLADHAADFGIELTEEQKTKVAESLQEFLTTYPVLSEHTDATEEQMRGWLEQNAVANLVANAVREAADTTVADEEIQAYAVEYITVNKPEETTEAAETEAAETEAAESAEVETEAAETAAETAAVEREAPETAEETAEVVVDEDVTAEAAEDVTAEAAETEEAGEALPEGEELANQVLAMAQNGADFDTIDEALGTTHDHTSYLVTGETSTDSNT